MDWAVKRRKTQIRRVAPPRFAPPRAASLRAAPHDDEGSFGSPHNSPLSTVHWWAVPPLRSALHSHATPRHATPRTTTRPQGTGAASHHLLQAHEPSR